MKLTTLSIAMFVSLSITAACKDDGGGGSVCDKAVDNSIKIVKQAFPDAPADKDRKEMLAECAKKTPEQQKCAADAKSIEDLMKCGA